ncbi:hypothetical protein [Actinomycetospora sp. TBRC 11914]|uniref:hypothetical protein n=1 Tax=Actinomycetospora sp. TBRC 11914 TaxID=2729387 RepID=UPI00145CA2D5|nr:hypothetical protein [Actinomycetospora sp. TBRC 11914]NMO91027.1 hypothetical protein [Actinomycetospora sp. TBRC 11914]
MTLDAITTRRVGLPVDGRGDLPDAATLSARLDDAVDRAVGARLDVELHVSPGCEVLPAAAAEVVAAARESAARRGVDLRVVS